MHVLAHALALARLARLARARRGMQPAGLHLVDVGTAVRRRVVARQQRPCGGEFHLVQVHDERRLERQQASRDVSGPALATVSVSRW